MTYLSFTLILLLSFILLTKINAQDDSSAQLATQQNTPISNLLGQNLHALQLIDPTPSSQEEESEQTAELHQYPTTLSLASVDVVGLYFSSEWCGPCKQFTPKLVEFQQSVNLKSLKKLAGLSSDSGGGDNTEDQLDGITFPLQVVYIPVNPKSFEAYASYFSQMIGFLSIPFTEPETAQRLAEKYGVKGIPNLVFIDRKTGKTINKNGVELVSNDKTGINFPYHPVSHRLIKIATSPFRLLRQLLRPVRFVVGGLLKVLRNVLRGLIGMK